MNKRNFILIPAILYLTSCQKQPISQTRSIEKQQSPTSINPERRTTLKQIPSPQQERWLFGLFRKKTELNWGDQLIVEYEERMQQNVKDRQKRAKEMEKPQYSDWTYFGHKRKPKKRPPEKMKYCKECGIRH